MRLITLIPLLLIFVLALALRLLSREAPGDSHPSPSVRPANETRRRPADYWFLPTFITKDAFQWEIPLVLWKRGFIKSWLEISTEHRYKRKLFATICLGGTRAFATGPSLICTPKGNAYLTGHQNTGVVSSGFDTFIATVTVNDATHIHTWGREPRNNLPILRHHITF